MGMLAWIMMSLAIWHFTIFLPDREWGGIVGALLGAMFGGIIFGLLVNGLHVPGKSDISLVTSVEAIPGALLGIALVYYLGVRQERAAAAARGR
jgi:hypothetical protein